MTGDKKLKEQLDYAGNSTDEMLAIMNKALEEYKSNLSMPDLDGFEDDIGEWLNADAKVLSMMDAHSCAEVAHMMLRYHTFLVSHLSHEKVQLKTLNALIYQWSQGHWNKFPERNFMSNDMKVYAIAKRFNTALQVPLSLKRFVESRIETVEGMAAAAKDHYHFFMNFARIKNA